MLRDFLTVLAPGLVIMQVAGADCLDNVWVTFLVQSGFGLW